jgi:tRNA-dihydrouridine synthase B
MIKKLKIRDIELKNNLILAPLAGITIKPFRLNAQSFGAGLTFTEMISAHGIIYKNKKTLKMIDISNEKEPVVVQIFGNDAKIMGEASKVLENMHAKIIDINMGCPATKVVSSGSGSAILKDLKKVTEIIQTVRKSINIPLTLKIRAGWDLENINAEEVANIAENEGVELITVHARTRTQKFNDFDWEIIKKVKNKVKIPVIGNGNIFTVFDVKNMYEKTNCDGFMIGRATLSNPWIFRQILQYSENETKNIEISNNERINYIKKFVKEFLNYKGEKGIFEVRKFIAWLVKGLPNAKTLREKFFQLENINDILSNLENL